MTEAGAQIRLPVQRIAPDTIRLERLLDAPVETVWRYLTEAELRRQWFMGGTDARPDSEFELLNDHDNLSDEPAPYPASYAEFKGRTWMVTPPDYDPAKKYPMVLEIHGGPYAAYGPQFSTDDQLYAADGYVVVYANPRGSTSYGEEFANGTALAPRSDRN